MNLDQPRRQCHVALTGSKPSLAWNQPKEETRLAKLNGAGRERKYISGIEPKSKNECPYRLS